jgi:hypothetical protein
VRYFNKLLPHHHCPDGVAVYIYNVVNKTFSLYVWIFCFISLTNGRYEMMLTVVFHKNTLSGFANHGISIDKIQYKTCDMFMENLRLS